MMGGCGTPVPFYSWRRSCANLYTLQSRSRSLINNKSSRAQKSPESAERAGTKKSLHIWRCVMSSRGAFKAAFHQTHLMSRTNNTACQGRRALACAYYNAPQNPLVRLRRLCRFVLANCRSRPRVSGSFERELEVASISMTKDPAHCTTKGGALGATGNQSSKQWLRSIWRVFKSEASCVEREGINNSSRLTEIWKVLNLLW